MKINASTKSDERTMPVRSPVHVVYGGADRFGPGTPQKLGAIALKSLRSYAPNFAEFARVFGIKGSHELPTDTRAIADLGSKLERSAASLRQANPAAFLAWTIYQRTVRKLRDEPVEDFRIDFEDGYGFRSDEEEDTHAVAASTVLAQSFVEGTITPFCGLRIKSLGAETHRRAMRTLDLFVDNFLTKASGKVPETFVITLPKVNSRKEVAELSEKLARIEKKAKLTAGTIGIELMAETPRAILDKKGRAGLPSLIAAARGRCRAVHFGAYDYTALLGISAVHQKLDHPACDFARNMIQVSAAPFGIRCSDSVTIEIPVPVHTDPRLTNAQRAENKKDIHHAWRTHFDNITRSMANGFYQSWDLHPNQLVARYAAVFAFFIESADAQGKRLRGFIERSTQATMTGNTFDDAASAQGLMNFFRMGIDCGALNEKEVKSACGLSLREIRSSFSQIAANRRT